MKRLIILACIALTGCASMSDRQKAVVGVVVVVAATSVALSSEHHGIIALHIPAPGKAYIPATPDRDSSR
jgi:uncharacterized protein YceK